MKHKILITCLVMILVLSAVARESGKDFNRPGTTASIDFQTWINSNKILMFITNKGSFAYDNGTFFGKADGMYYPYTSIADIESGRNDLCVIYAGSVWMGAVDSATGDTLVTSGQHDTDWGIGPIIGGLPPADAVSNLRWRVYKLHADSLADNPNQDYLEWPIADGAPWDTTDAGDTIPAFIENADQMLWSVTNDIDPIYHIGNAGTIGQGLGIEMRQTTFAFAFQGALSNIVFIKFAFYNKGNMTLQDMYVSVWADPDLGDASDDFVGCDTILSLGYCYNAEDVDSDYGSKPPATGYDFFQGPLVFTADDADTARMWGQLYPQYTNMGMTSFNKYVNPFGPDVPRESYRFMTGLFKDGSPLLDHNGDTTNYFGYGDPVTGSGFLDADPADRRFMQSTGPFTFRPGDSTEIIVAVMAAQGENRLESITQLKAVDAFAQKVYENNFVLPAPPAAPDLSAVELDGEIVLTWGTASEDAPGGYPFEGYAVLQGETTLGPWDTLAWFDLINNITGVKDYVVDPILNPLAVELMLKPGTDEGLGHTYTVTRDKINGGPLRNYTDYIFRVEAYSVDLTAPATEKTLTSNGTVVTVTPHSLFDTKPNPPPGDTLIVTKIGISDGTVTAVVIDPSAVTGEAYTVEFSTDPDLGPVWHLLNDAGDTLMANQTNQGLEGEINYLVADGLQVIVRGPEPGVKPGDSFDQPGDPSAWGWDIPNGTRRFTWAEADGWPWEGFRGAIGWGGPGDTHGYGSNDPVDPAALPDVLLKLATVDSAGNFDPNDPNVSYAYRYGRGFTNPPARPEFAPFMINTVDGGYRFQDYELSCPLSAWNVSVDPPQRLAIGYLENNVALATLDGMYFPPESDSLAAWGTDMVSSSGPREWLWIFLDDYTAGTPDPAYQLDATTDPMPVMYWLTVARRGSNVPFSPDSSGQDEFLIIPNKVNSSAVTFSFDTYDFTPTTLAATASLLDNIRPVPNPFYLFSSYDPSTYNKILKFTNVPEKCTVTIYTLTGDQVQVLTKDDASTFIEWNMLNYVNIPIASGIYIYVVDAPGIGQKIGKVAVFTETEVLDQF